MRLEKLRERELKELEECTFKPKTNRSEISVNKEKKRAGYVKAHLRKNASKKPVVVRGLGRYLELRNLANAKEREKKERETAAFSVSKRLVASKYPDGTTQIREFRLSKSRGEQSSSAARC